MSQAPGEQFVTTVEVLLWWDVKPVSADGVIGVSE